MAIPQGWLKGLLFLLANNRLNFYKNNQQPTYYLLNYSLTNLLLIKLLNYNHSTT